MAYSLEVKNTAHKLFLTPNLEGKRKYSGDEIAIELEKEYPNEDTPSGSTILRWAKVKDKETGMSWHDEWLQIVKSAVVSAKKEVVENLAGDELLFEQAEKFQSYLAGMAMDMVTKGRRYFKSKDYMPESPWEALQMMSFGLNTFNAMQDEIAASDKEHTIKIIEITPDGEEIDKTEEFMAKTQKLHKDKGETGNAPEYDAIDLPEHNSPKE